AGAQVNKTEVRTAGVIEFHRLKTAKLNDGSIIIMNKVGEIYVKNAQGVVKERYPGVYGARIFIEEGGSVTPGQRILEWDPFAIPILSEVSGTIRYEDLVVGKTIKEQIDAVTGLTHKVIVETKDTALQARIAICDDNGKVMIVPGTKREAVYRLPAHAHIVVDDGEKIEIGHAISKAQRETTKTKDITGGLPRVAELFEARKPSNAAQISDISGTIEFGPELRGSRRVIVRPEDGGDIMTYSVPKGRYIIVNEGDYIRAGEAIMDGPANPHDLLRVMGVKALASYIVDEIQEVYRLQGVKIDDKHIEVIVSQMLKKVQIEDAGDTNFIQGDSVTKHIFEEANAALDPDEQPAKARSLLLGITKASLTTESFISAASFQETTKVLTQAALEGKSDKLRGLKENVIMGRLIPAGTGISRYRDYEAMVDEEEQDKIEAVGLQI
ncbi:MAG: DNA-directed RNA polymerase subunit beta', partial [Epsilonproteobacteria bacterium]